MRRTALPRPSRPASRDALSPCSPRPADTGRTARPDGHRRARLGRDRLHAERDPAERVPDADHVHTTTAALYVDVHYLVNGANQQNFRMANSNGTWTQTVSSLSTGNVLEYWFTYEKNGPQYDTPHFTYTQTSGTTGRSRRDVQSGRGNVHSAQTVTLADSTSGASIRYTLDGSTPRPPPPSTAPRSASPRPPPSSHRHPVR